MCASSKLLKRTKGRYRLFKDPDSPEYWLRACPDFQEYMERALQIKQKLGYSQIYIATDSAEVIANTSAYSDEFEFVYYQNRQFNRSRFDPSDGAWVEDRLEKNPDLFGPDPIMDVLVDVWAGSSCSVFVGQMGSNLGRLMYGLMNSRHAAQQPAYMLDVPLDLTQKTKETI